MDRAEAEAEGLTHPRARAEDGLGVELVFVDRNEVRTFHLVLCALDLRPDVRLVDVCRSLVDLHGIAVHDCRCRRFGGP